MKRPNAASLIVFGFSLGLVISANAATIGSAVFPDVPGGTYYDSAIGDMYTAGIITGYADGKFGPNDYVTRGQVAVMMQRLKAHLTGQNIAVSSSSRSVVSSSSSSSSVSQVTNTQGSFRFTTGSYKADEDRGTITVSVIRYGGNAGTVTVEYELEDGTANKGSDYDEASGTLTFADGKTTATFDIRIEDDNEAESNETIFLKLKDSGGGAQVGTPNVATLTIVDNDSGDGSSTDPANSKGVFTFSAAEYEIAENLNEIDITIEREGTEGEASVKFTSTNGTADSTYYDKNDATFTFGDGEKTRTITLNIKDNGLTNGNKTVNLKLSSPTGGATLGSLSTSTLIIVDDEITSFGNGTFKLKDDEYSASEGESVVITIDRYSGAKGEVTVDYETINTLAKSGDDYTETSGTLTFKEGEAQKIISVPILDDNNNDPRETFRFKISNATGGANVDTPSEAIVTIQ